MCIIIYHEAGQKIPERYLQNSIKNHPDGFGLTYVGKRGLPIIYKTLEGEALIHEYNKLVTEFPDSPFIVHCRRMTAGSVNEANCHPFKIDKYHVFAHNGIIRDCDPDIKNIRDISDTRNFNELVMRRLPAGWFKNEAIKRVLEIYIGGSKLAILGPKKEVWLINEDKGEWANEIWYSNSSYKSGPVVVKAERHDKGVFEDYQAGEYSAPWNQDGLRMRWNIRLDVPEAFDTMQNKYREYDLIHHIFVDRPHTVHGHTAHEDGYCDVVTLPSKERCAFCKQFHCSDELMDLLMEGHKEFHRVCEDCITFLKTVDYNAIPRKQVEN